MQVHLIGDDPVRESVVASLADIDVDVVDASASALEDARVGIVSGVAGDELFQRANEAARSGSTPWLAVEIGGLGGHPLAELDAAVSGFAPNTGCFDCLRARVASAVDDSSAEPKAGRSAVRLAGAVAGNECVRVLTGEADSVLGYVHEVPHAKRRLLPVPGCGCDASGRDRTIDLDDEGALALEEAVERAEMAIDSRLGPVATIGEIESFPAPYYLSTLTDTEPFSDASAPTQAAGVAVDWNTALMKAVGEGLERYCAGVYREADFVRASAADLENAVTLDDLVRPDDSPRIDDETKLRWVEGVNLESSERAHFPAAAVQFPQPGERLLPPITTGLGLGSSTVDALCSGLTEVVERDATMLAWYSTYEPLGLSVDDEGFETLARRARSEGLSVTPLLVTQDIDVPVVSVAVHRNPDRESVDADEWPHFATGSAADLDAAAAARGALEEALQNWMELRGMGDEAAAGAKGRIGEYGSFPEPVRAFVDVDRTVPADSIGPDPVPTGRSALEALVSRVSDVGLTPYATRLTTRDVEQIGFEAVRVVVPGAQPLFTRDAYFGERARSVPEALGFEARLDRSYHPYP